VKKEAKMKFKVQSLSGSFLGFAFTISLVMLVMLAMTAQAAKIIWVSDAVAPASSGYEFWD
jgi:hypothetical protein